MERLTRHAGKRFLVVDDDPDVRSIICELLEGVGIDVLEAGDGIAALHVFGQNQDISLLVTDLRMPNMDGVALIEAITLADPKLPIIIMSGFPLPQVDLTKHRFLQKPFRMKAFAIEVAQLLQHSPDCRP